MSVTILSAIGLDRLIWLALLIVLLLVARVALAGRAGPPQPVARPFLTERERAMLRALEQVLPTYRVHAQVAMGAILKAPARPVGRSRPSDRNAFSQKIVDFVVEDIATGRVVVLIELDDRSHDPERDQRRDAMTRRAGYMTIRIPASARPTVTTAFEAVGHLRLPVIEKKQHADRHSGPPGSSYASATSDTLPRGAG